jgi:hypothetical protein
MSAAIDLPFRSAMVLIAGSPVMTTSAFSRA